MRVSARAWSKMNWKVILMERNEWFAEIWSNIKIKLAQRSIFSSIIRSWYQSIQYWQIHVKIARESPEIWAEIRTIFKIAFEFRDSKKCPPKLFSSKNRSEKFEKMKRREQLPLDHARMPSLTIVNHDLAHYNTSQLDFPPAHPLWLLPIRQIAHKCCWCCW